MSKISEIELKNALKYSQPIIINGSEYAEPTMCSESCDRIPFVTIPIYELKNFDTKQIVYIALDNNKVSLSNKNINGLRCAVCEICNNSDAKFFVCAKGRNKVINKNDYLKELVKVINLKQGKENEKR